MLIIVLRQMFNSWNISCWITRVFALRTTFVQMSIMRERKGDDFLWWGRCIAWVVQCARKINSVEQFFLRHRSQWNNINVWARWTIILETSQVQQQNKSLRTRNDCSRDIVLKTSFKWTTWMHTDREQLSVDENNESAICFAWILSNVRKHRS